MAVGGATTGAGEGDALLSFLVGGQVVVPSGGGVVAVIGVARWWDGGGGAVAGADSEEAGGEAGAVFLFLRGTADKRFLPEATKCSRRLEIQVVWT